ncbi:MAG: radical SAM protein, partial [Candidatus Acidiferrales bacterium]
MMGITQEEALDLFQSDDIVAIGMAANEVRRKKTDPRIATYQIDRNINYTNFCTEYCSFCAFYRPMGSKEGYVLSFEEICHKIDEMIELGGSGILLQGGLNTDLKLDYYENLLRSLKQKYPRVHLHCFSAPEIICISEISGLSVRDTIARLRDAGLESIPGGGAEILDDEIRARISRLKCTSAEWELVHREAHSLG